MRAQFVWDLPRLPSDSARRACSATSSTTGACPASGRARSGAAYSVTAAYQNGGGNVNLTGSPDFAPRVRVVGDPGARLQRRSAAAVQHRRVPRAGRRQRRSRVGQRLSDGLLHQQHWISRSRARSSWAATAALQLRADVFNLFNQAGIIARQTTMNLTSPSDPATITNLPFDAAGNVIPARAKPNGAGFGVATDYQPPRTDAAPAAVRILKFSGRRGIACPASRRGFEVSRFRVPAFRGSWFRSSGVPEFRGFRSLGSGVSLRAQERRTSQT